ncbi:unnamed protein product [Pleuronectes platessa]|uniref:Uncharacterized protein n=1 Tax=Pleuronectes platessa TaxID=8262 RepID=A0A9N7U9H2_PLEPL|nr:unnamed protein product [Pleuronectes platessa]
MCSRSSDQYPRFINPHPECAELEAGGRADPSSPPSHCIPPSLHPSIPLFSSVWVRFMSSMSNHIEEGWEGEEIKGRDGQREGWMDGWKEIRGEKGRREGGREGWMEIRGEMERRDGWKEIS